jgi:hypothetical protein
VDSRRGEIMSDKQVEAERRRGDFFRDVLVMEYGCPLPSLLPLGFCGYGTPCPYGIDDDDEAAWQKCWDEVERRQR